MRSINRVLQFVVATVMFLVFFAFILATIVLLSSGLLAIFVSLLAVTGVFTNVASDLAPTAMLLAGICFLSTGLLLTLAIVILFPKQPAVLRRLFGGRQV